MDQKIWGGIAGAAIVAFVIGMLIVFDVFESDSEKHAANCHKATGSETTAGLEMSQSKKSSSFSMGIKEFTAGSDDKDIVKLVIDCIQSAYDKKGAKNDYHTAEPVQFGLVADQWSGGDVTLHIQSAGSGESSDILNNLAFGPAAGLRSELIELWCERNSSCVACVPNLGAASLSEASTISISLKPEATAEKLYYGTAPLAGNRKHPWQIVEATDSVTHEGIGERVIYQCTRN